MLDCKNGASLRAYFLDDKKQKTHGLFRHFAHYKFQLFWIDRRVKAVSKLVKFLGHFFGLFGQQMQDVKRTPRQHLTRFDALQNPLRFYDVITSALDIILHTNRLLIANNAVSVLTFETKQFSIKLNTSLISGVSAHQLHKVFNV